MTSTRIHLLVSDRRFMLMVFYCEEQQVWQFRVLRGTGVFGEGKIYYTAETAEKAAREWIAADS
ncbi:hypothetical protein C7Y66_25405 [Chroococcidiopsis sp. CCALA 051]|uniref:hypothetical protein n=1 Tax=Chroococcidiopsis sp. CCALA 051 TaxID=869949 RepID=UPI000D0E23E9|nr:hypothetical protein [Chroococcidiopsis sp. CCALA 051]MBE9017048.1 hypothetical protein [Chroococcidiopsidales cyanobacterium LEGE 13417]PSM46360.1 hypothetical protein C7Y66_25405 [Chroococcidiopsis sp. CCALA 051]